MDQCDDIRQSRTPVPRRDNRVEKKLEIREEINELQLRGPTCWILC